MTDWNYANPLPYATAFYGGMWPRTPIEVQGQQERPAPATTDGEPRTLQQTDIWRPLGYGVTACVAGMSVPPPGDYPIWRAMDADPALTLSRAVITAPIREAGKAYEAREGTPDEWVRKIQSAIDPLWDEALGENLDGLSMGWKPSEAVFARRDNFTALVDLKPLAQELSAVLTRNGAFAGIRNERGPNNQYIDLPPEQCFVTTIDGKNRNVYGRPWHENARQAWWDKLHVLANLAKLNKKASGIQGTMYYPPASDEAVNHTNEKLAQALLKRKMEGDGAVLPNAAGLLDADTAADFRNIKGLAAAALWQFQLDDHGNIGPEATAMLDQLRYHNADLSRAWYVPERSSQEAVTAGSRADSESAGDIAMSVAQLVFNGICEAMSRGPIDTMLVQNYGERARGAVKLVAGKLRDVYAEGDWKLIDAVLAQPDLFMAIAEQVDLDAVFTRRGIPKVKGVLTFQEAVRKAQASRKASQDAAQAAAEKPVNGNGRLAMSREQEAKASEWMDGLAMLGRIGQDNHEH